MTACELCLPVDLERSTPGQPAAVCASTLIAPTPLSPLSCPAQHAAALGRALDRTELYGIAEAVDEPVGVSRSGHLEPWVRLDDLLDELKPRTVDEARRLWLNEWTTPADPSAPPSVAELDHLARLDLKRRPSADGGVA